MMSANDKSVATSLKWISCHPWLLLPVVAIPALLPFVTIGLTASADGMSHLIRVALLDYHWQQGIIYPRWVPELVTGLGYPVFNFYGPLTYFLAAFFHQFGLTSVSSLVLAFCFFIVAGGFGMAALARDVFGERHPWAAFLAATAYMYGPYLLTNAYIRGAIAEVGAQALLPWILWSTRRLLTKESPARYVLPLALTLGGLAITHTITLILFPPFLLGYALVVWWQSGHQPARLGWAAAGFGAALGISAFFWIPLIWERQYLSQVAFDISTEIFVPENIWTWRTFLDTHFAFEHTFAIPFQLGLVQLSLAIIGLIVARRRDPEWVYLIIATLIACVSIGAWSEPIWLSNQVLLVVQFPWRLLTIITVTLSLLTGALVVRLHRERSQAFAALAFTLLIVAANRPQIGWMGELETANDTMPLPAIARHETLTGQVGTGPTREFMPRWNKDRHYTVSAADVAIDHAEVVLERAGVFGLDVAISSPAGGPLRFESFYFPGWQAVLDGDTVLSTYPSTNLGLVTVDVPPGSHSLRLIYANTPLERWAMWITLVILAGLAAFVWRFTKPRWIAVVPLALLLVGLAIQLSRPSLPAIHQPERPVTTPDLTLLGYRLEQGADDSLLIYLTWFVNKTPPVNTRLSWTLRDASGRTVNQMVSRPYFNGQEASDWPAGTIVDDAYELHLPPDLPAGAYEVATEVLGPESRPGPTQIPIGSVDLKSRTSGSKAGSPSNPLALQFGEDIRLEGYDVQQNKRQVAPGTGTASIRPGDTLNYSLYWRAVGAPSRDYHGFVHLVDREGKAVAQDDHLPGSYFRPPTMWDTANIQLDTYKLQVPEGLANELVWPIIGLYDYETQDLLPIRDTAGQVVGDVYRLPPVKVFGANAPVSPQHPVQARLGEGAILLGYDLSLSETSLRAGNQLTLTLYYQSEASIPKDLTQFVHFSNPALGMAAQKDAPPLDGANPTSTWMPGEIIVNRVSLVVAEDAAPGTYTLTVGLYDPSDGTRSRATDKTGNSLPDNAVPLVDLSVEP